MLPLRPPPTVVSVARVAGRVAALDGLRGLAALAVALGHALLVVRENVVADWLGGSALALTTNGFSIAASHAVWLFFVLSGVVLTKLATRGPPGTFDYGRYTLSRLARLYLPVWAALAFMVVTVLLVRRTSSGFGAWVDGHPTHLDPWALLNDATLLTGTSGALSPLWTLQWEVLFSLLLVLYLAVLQRVPAVLALVMLVACSSLGGVLGNPTLLYLPMFGLGVVLALNWAALARAAAGLDAVVRRRRGGVTVTTVVALALTTEAAFLGWQLTTSPLIAPPARSALETVGHLAASMLLILLAGLWPPVRRAFSSRPLQWLGLVSFSLYLVHEPVLLAVVRLAVPAHDAACTLGLCPPAPAGFSALPGSALTDGFSALPGSALADLGAPGIVLMAVVAIALSLAVAAAFHRLVERPAHRFAQRLRADSPHPRLNRTGGTP
ncbi:acyltransferase [Herbiconiux sp. CPCC 205716]|uniref:Acyltransferase n=1 Tax=Herbiconiux gentiana TaxID=2970912 RepID=A0ABT2GIH8_9MICO|nr:acyltransferase [Herbiconiux gentiana]MCS5716030.1 acyltransferase [Herbiconiux gentiana]